MCLIPLNNLHFNLQPNSHREKESHPNSLNICEGHDPVKAPNDCVSSFIVRQEMYLSLTGMSYSDQLESPSVVQTKEAARKIEENELHLAAAPVDLTHVMFWPGKL